MAGDDFSSTDLHLANGDTLLVGQVAELKQVNAAELGANTRLHHRKLQVRLSITRRHTPMIFVLRQRDLFSAYFTSSVLNKLVCPVMDNSKVQNRRALDGKSRAVSMTSGHSID